MFKSLAYGCVLLAFTAGCSSSLPSATDVETSQPALTNTPSKEALVEIAPTPTLSEQPTKNNILEPAVEKICPSKPEVSIDNLGLPNNLALLTVSEDEELRGAVVSLSTDVLSYSGTSNIPDKLTEINKSNEDGIIDLSISPGGVWMIILRRNDDNGHKTIWAGTVDGQNQWKVKELMRYQDVYWINDNEILVTGRPDESEDMERGISILDKMPLYRINPFTMEIQDLAPLPPGMAYELYSYNVINGRPYALYRDSASLFVYLYDYDLATSTRAFQWIDFSNLSAGVITKENGLYTVAMNKDGLEFSDLTIEQITKNYSFDDVMKQLYINGHKFAPSLFTPRGKYYLAALHDDLADPNQSVYYYLYDYKANILKDYCLLKEIRSVTVSPDGNFAAFTILDGDEQTGENVLVLNLETGYYSLIPNSQDVGFWKKE